MKQASLLIALLVFLGTTLLAQTTTTVEKKINRITITTSHLDENGKPVTETWIAEGEQPEAILRNMAINPDVLQKVESEKALEAENNKERLFLFRHAGDHTVIEGTLEDAVSPDAETKDINREIIVIRKDDGKAIKEYKKISAYPVEGHEMAYAYKSDPDRKANCAALGVYVNYDVENSGCRIRSLIDLGGAQEAGLKEGDVITRIDEFNIDDYSTLHLAMSHFAPGDRVVVRFLRDGKESKAKVNLTSWSDLPGHEWRARTDCGDPSSIKETPVEPQLEDDPNGVVGTQELQLTDAKVYPNPTEGLFAFSFTTKPGPLSIAITDVNGKVIYQEENQNSTGIYNRDIDIKEMPAGNYILSVKQGERIFTRQISKQ